jgi:hypothetical protein
MRTCAFIVVAIAACGDNRVAPPDAPPAMHLRAVTPPHGPQVGGTTIVLDGDGFDPDAPPPTVIIGRALATEVGVLDPYTITATTPFGAQSGPADVVIADRDTHTRLDLGFTYDALPYAISFAPTSGPSTGGTRVAITGQGFVANGGGDPTVRFGDLEATDVVVVSDAEIDATTPPGPPFANVPITISNHNGASPGLYGFRFTARGLVVGANYYGPPIGMFYVDPATGLTTEMAGLDYDPFTQNTMHTLANDGHVLWGTTHWYQAPPVLFSFDPAELFARTHGDVLVPDGNGPGMPSNLDCIDLEVVADTLYCMAYGALYTIDRTTSTATRIATTAEPPYDVALANVGATTYLVWGECCTQAAFAPIDLATGATGASIPITLDGQPLDVYVASATGYDGAIYLLVQGGFGEGKAPDVPVQPQDGQIYRVDVATGAATMIGKVPFLPVSLTTIDP